MREFYNVKIIVAVRVLKRYAQLSCCTSCSIIVIFNSGVSQQGVGFRIGARIQVSFRDFRLVRVVLARIQPHPPPSNRGRNKSAHTCYWSPECVSIDHLSRSTPSFKISLNMNPGVNLALCPPAAIQYKVSSYRVALCWEGFAPTGWAHKSVLS